MRSALLLSVVFWGSYVMAVDAALLARVTLMPTDLAGNTIATVNVGDEFLLQAFVDDLRDNGEGVFAASLDLRFDAHRLMRSPNGQLVWGPKYGEFAYYGAQAEAGWIRGISAAAADFFDPPGNDPQLFFQMPLVATRTGDVEISPSFSTLRQEDYDFLMFGLDYSLVSDEVQFVGSSLRIVPEPSSVALLSAGVCLMTVCARKRKSSM